LPDVAECCCSTNLLQTRCNRGARSRVHAHVSETEAGLPGWLPSRGAWTALRMRWLVAAGLLLLLLLLPACGGQGSVLHSTAHCSQQVEQVHCHLNAGNMATHSRHTPNCNAKLSPYLACLVQAPVHGCRPDAVCHRPSAPLQDL
jgi:hypothetical protein